MTSDLSHRFIEARREYIARQFSNLNPQQQKAALTTEGPLLLLAGAGSGKTTVLIHRIANLIRFGRGSNTHEIPFEVSSEQIALLEKEQSQLTPQQIQLLDELCAVEPAAPWSILAITFTNKAANELKERLAAQLGPQANDIWAMTFHSACCRILRRNIERLGYSPSFTIYDSADSERVMKDILNEMGLDDKVFAPRYVLSIISKEKDRFVSSEEMLINARGASDVRYLQIARAYQRYQQKLKDNNALDFDDLIMLTVKLLQDHEDIRTYYQRKFRYVLVDEYQDTNHLQYLLTSLLAGGYENICVVGDDDQSIYRFRGATIENILNFEKQYRGAQVIRLEQNYRSTQSILNAANAVIAHNTGRKGKKLWTSNPAGEPITVYEAGDEGQEANFVADEILRLSRGRDFQNYAILYRTNAQSNALEYAMKRNGIPYRIIGGTRFFDRAEVKDMLAYLWVINNRSDDLRLNRIINQPPRGLGAKSLETAQRLATAEGVAFYEVIRNANLYAPLEKIAGKFLRFAQIIEGLAQLLEEGLPLPEFYEEVMLRTGYIDMLQSKDTEENRTRLENIRELKSSIISYCNDASDPSLSGFLEEIALYTDIENYNQGESAIVMMTMHASKGLEFPHVFLVGFEDGLFPGMRSIGDYEEMEEERRLCYVAITRAKKTLTITHARQRMLYGRTAGCMPSRFLKELPEAQLRRLGGFVQSSYSSYRPAFPSGLGSAPKQHLPRTAPAPEAKPYLRLNKGDMVEHKAFGRGMVLTAIEMGSDTLLEIAFDQVGTKKLLAKTASAHMKKL